MRFFLPSICERPTAKTLIVRMSAYGPSVWTGRAMQVESDDLEIIGLAHLYPALERNVVFLATSKRGADVRPDFPPAKMGIG